MTIDKSRFRKYLKSDVFKRKAEKIVSILKDEYNKIVKNKPTLDDTCKMFTAILFPKFKISFQSIQNESDVKSDQYPNGNIFILLNKEDFNVITNLLEKELKLRQDLQKKNLKEIVEDLPNKPIKQYLISNIDFLSKQISREEKAIGSSKYYLLYNIVFENEKAIIDDLEKRIDFYNKNDKEIDRWLELQRF